MAEWCRRYQKRVARPGATAEEKHAVALHNYRIANSYPNFDYAEISSATRELQRTELALIEERNA